MKKACATVWLASSFALTGCSVSPYYHLYIMADMDASNEDLITVIDQPGFDPDAERGRDWVPPLCGLAAYDQRNPVIEHLIDKGASLNTCFDSIETTTPLHLAAQGNATNNIRTLLQHQADPALHDYQNRTPLDVAIEEDSQAAAAILEQEKQARTAWQEANHEATADAYRRFLSRHADSFHGPTARARLAEVEATELARQQASERQQALENSLPASVRRDKYLIALSEHLKAHNYSAALPLFEKLAALPTHQDPSLDFFHGQAVLKTGQPTPALQKLYRYVSQQGQDAKHYRQALTLINEAESQL